ncbi:uncharacterized protein [Leptinotarsa decemlineata]|uniref:uncharacterized protein n=1 Tax=Leptinotarsa decemlineata TaxID=7539 RepID=UPI003D3052C4
MVCLHLSLIFAVTGLCAAIPKPIDWDEVGTKIKNFGEKALPIARGACGVLNNFPQTGYPQVQGYYPSVQTYYPSQGRGFPQAPDLPAYYPPNWNNYPQFGNGFPQYPSNFPPTHSKPDENLPPTTIEQDDLNRGVENPPKIPSYIPPTEDDFEWDDSDVDFLGNEISEEKKTLPKESGNLYRTSNQPKQKYRHILNV